MTAAWMRCCDPVGAAMTTWAVRARRVCALGFACLALLLAAAPSAFAHKSSDAYLVFTPRDDGTLALRWDIALRDLDAVLPTLDADGNREITFGEVKAARPAIEAYALPRLRIDGCRFAATGHALEQRADGAYAVLNLEAGCRLAAQAPIGYSLFAEADPTHRGIAKIVQPDGSVQVRLLDPLAPAGAAASAAGSSGGASGVEGQAPSAAPASFLAEGVHHIVTGYDHVLFLLCLLLPAVLRRTPQGWRPVERWRDAVLPVAGIVTLFTLAHSITLALAALKLVSLPAWFIEPAIAVTIAVAALDNLRPVFGRARYLVTFLFGLIHGFGFAGVLAELDLPTAAFGWALLQFNVGLEMGQLVIVALVTPLLFAGRRSDAYRVWVLRSGSMLAIGIALWWFAERTRPAWA